MARQWLRLFAGATLTLSVAGHALAEEGKITVFAAASLTNAMQDIAKAYKKEKNVDVVSSFASSSTLARQIEAGRLRICLSPPTRNGWITRSRKSD
jgi:molybdate transport system substrate-binding protein